MSVEGNFTGNVTGFTPVPELPAVVPPALASPEVILLSVAVIIAIGVIGEAFFRKTRIPDVAFLMLLGLLVGPVFGIVSFNTAVTVVPYFAAIALMLIMFDGGLNLPIKNLISTAHYAAILSATGFAASIIAVALVAVFLLSWDWPSAILLGTMVGGASSIIVFGLVRRLPLKEETKAMLSLESALTDILATLGAFVMFGIIIGGLLDPGAIAGSALGSVGVGLGLGLGAGIPWIFVESKLHNNKHSYMFTLAALFSLFFLARSLGESGALTALVFGLTIGNRTLLAKYLKIDPERVSTDDPFHDEVVFLVRTFFFIFIGLLATFGRVDHILAGIGMAVLLLLGRVAAAKFAFKAGTSVMKGLDRLLPANLQVKEVLIPPYDRKITSFMMPRGLAAAVLSTLPLGLGFPNAELYPQIVFMVILGSVGITTAGLIRAAKAQPKQTPPTG